MFYYTIVSQTKTQVLPFLTKFLAQINNTLLKLKQNKQFRQFYMIPWPLNVFEEEEGNV